MTKLYFEDIDIGQKFIGTTVTVDPDRMVAMAREFDDQAMHTDAAAAQAMGLDGIIASGVYIFALSAKSCIAIWDRLHFLPSGLGFQMSFTKPVYGGDELHLEIQVANKRASRNPARGVLELKQTLINQNGDAVLDVENVWLVRTKAGA